jgi:hypothetical protein
MPFWVQNGWFKDFKKILFGLNGPFWGQKASFKTVLGPILEFFRRYYSWLPWSDPNNDQGAPLDSEALRLLQRWG